MMGNDRNHNSQKEWLSRIGRMEEQFELLQKKWYDKLAKEGFEDCEDIGPNRFLKRWHSSDFLARCTAPDFQQTQEYWDDCDAFLHSHRFEKPIEKRVWELHCVGLTQREIEEAIATRKDAIRQGGKGGICRMLQRLHKIMRK